MKKKFLTGLMACFMATMSATVLATNWVDFHKTWMDNEEQVYSMDTDSIKVNNRDKILEYNIKISEVGTGISYYLTYQDKPTENEDRIVSGFVSQDGEIVSRNNKMGRWQEKPDDELNNNVSELIVDALTVESIGGKITNLVDDSLVKNPTNKNWYQSYSGFESPIKINLDTVRLDPDKHFIFFWAKAESYCMEWVFDTDTGLIAPLATGNLVAGKLVDKDGMMWTFWLPFDLDDIEDVSSEIDALRMFGVMATAEMLDYLKNHPNYLRKLQIEAGI